MGMAKESQQLENNSCIIKHTQNYASMCNKTTMVTWCHCAPQVKLWSPVDTEADFILGNKMLWELACGWGGTGDSKSRKVGYPCQRRELFSRFGSHSWTYVAQLFSAQWLWWSGVVRVMLWCAGQSTVASQYLIKTWILRSALWVCAQRPKNHFVYKKNPNKEPNSMLFSALSEKPQVVFHLAPHFGLSHLSNSCPTFEHYLHL